MRKAMRVGPALQLETVVVLRRNTHRLGCLNTCPQLTVLSGKAIGCLGHGASLEEVHHWEPALGVYSFPQSQFVLSTF